MTIELASLAVMTIFFCWAWLPGSIAKRNTYGRAWLISNRDPVNLPPLPEWGERSNRAYENLKNYFPAYAVAILALAHLGKSDASIRAAAVLFVVARLLHFAFYAGGWGLARGISWIFAIVANTYLLVRIF